MQIIYIPWPANLDSAGNPIAAPMAGSELSGDYLLNLLVLAIAKFRP